ncbi:MAG: hypothetical protein GXO95_01880 [Nitrospirae bacterium]|nr:hypothetical protein [Nitrospirota bacterium]
MKILRIQTGISVFALLVIAVHLIWPSLAIDRITLTLLIIAIIPWLAPLFKSLEFPGGWKIEFQDLLKAKDKADKAGLLAPSSTVATAPQYSFQVIAENDPNLALAGLRIEIEKRLIQLAEAKGIHVQSASVIRLMRLLAEHGVLTKQEHSVLADMIGLLSSAVHGATVDGRAVDWAMEVGPRLLKSLDNKISAE